MRMSHARFEPRIPGVLCISHKSQVGKPRGAKLCERAAVLVCRTDQLPRPNGRPGASPYSGAPVRGCGRLRYRMWKAGSPLAAIPAPRTAWAQLSVSIRAVTLASGRSSTGRLVRSGGLRR